MTHDVENSDKESNTLALLHREHPSDSLPAHESLDAALATSQAIVSSHKKQKFQNQKWAKEEFWSCCCCCCCQAHLEFTARRWSAGRSLRQDGRWRREGDEFSLQGSHTERHLTRVKFDKRGNSCHAWLGCLSCLIRPRCRCRVSVFLYWTTFWRKVCIWKTRVNVSCSYMQVMANIRIRMTLLTRPPLPGSILAIFLQRVYEKQPVVMSQGDTEEHFANFFAGGATLGSKIWEKSRSSSRWTKCFDESPQKETILWDI